MRCSSGNQTLDRRTALTCCLASLVSPTDALSSGAARAEAQDIDLWMTTWLQRKTLDGRLRLERFVEPIYFLTRPTTWRPGPGQEGLKSVTVPIGFVTDFASIPRIFWSILRPDGEYAHAAVVHDYLYWEQRTTRDAADQVFFAAMVDLGVQPETRVALYEAVRGFGSAAWKENARLRRTGEKRILRRFPKDPTARWSEWKLVPGVFG